jgi:hypothetical protein
MELVVIRAALGLDHRQRVAEYDSKGVYKG